MYEWLLQELAEIKTRKFHVTFAEQTSGWASRAVSWPSPPPVSFTEFIRKFGSATLYRELSYHLVRICESPIIERSRKGDTYLVFGGYDSGSAGFKPEELATGSKVPVWETLGVSDFHQTAETFEEWIEMRAKSARKRYSKKEWIAILQGPAPFSADELAIVRARAQFDWRLLGANESGALRFEVTNNSDRYLPYLSVGLRSPDLEGGAWLEVSKIGPGTTGVVEHDGYRNLTDPHTIEAFRLPHPEPEDRDRYWEFRESAAVKNP